MDLKLDVRTTLPIEMSRIDMDAKGNRSGPLEIYGWPTAPDRSILERLFAVWNVVDSYLTNPTGLQTNNSVPQITREGGPAYLLLFQDKKWRYASFRGINGPAWYHCDFAGGIEAPTGEIAWATILLNNAKLNHEKAMEDLLEATAKLDRATEKLQKLETALKTRSKA